MQTILVLLTLAWCALNANWQMTLDNGITVNMSFADASTLTITLTASDTHWLGVGLGPTMTDTDMFVIIPSGGSAAITDRYSTGQSMPRTDAESNVTLSSSLSGSTFTYTVTRALDTGDTTDDTVITTGTHTWCYAYGSSTTFANHGNMRRSTFTFSIDVSAMTTSFGSSTSGSTNTSGSFDAMSKSSIFTALLSAIIIALVSI